MGTVFLVVLGLLFSSGASAQSTPPIRPQASSLQHAGSTFWIDVEVGSDQVPVEDLFGVSFEMSYDTSRVDVLNDEVGRFLGSDLVYSSSVDTTEGKVGIGVSRKSGDGGVDGSGVVARVQVQVDSDVPEGDTLSFRLSDVSANDSDGNVIALDSGGRGVTVATAIPMQPEVQGLSDETPTPGDTVQVDAVVGSDAIPVSDLFGTGFTLTYDPADVEILSDTTGAFLGGDVVYSSNVDTTAGEVGIGVSRKVGYRGVTGAGSVARVTARIAPDVSEGSTVTFGLMNAQAKNPADSSISLNSSDSVITVGTATDPPQARDDTTLVRRGQSRVLNVLSNDAGDGEELDVSSVTVETEPSYGTVTVADDGTIAYAHDGSDTLSDAFTYTVADAGGTRSEPAEVLIKGADLQVEAEDATRGAPVSLSVIVEGPAAPTGILYARKGGADTYREIGLVEGGQEPLRLEGEIPGTLVTKRGVDYYLSLIDGRDTLTVPSGGVELAQRRPEHLAVQFDRLAPPAEGGFSPEAYQMVSVPARPAGGIKEALQSAYGGSYDPRVWRLLRWTAGDERAETGYREYPEIDSLQAGEAFWLVTVSGEAPTIEAGETVSGGRPREIPLEAGWNQVGSPFGYSVPWDTVWAASGFEEEKVDGPVAYQDSTGYRPGQEVLREWEGYFLFSAERDTLVVPPVGTEESTAKREGEDGRGKGPVALAGAGEVGAPINGEASRSSSSKNARAETVRGAKRDRGETSSGASSEEGSYTLRLEARPKEGRPSRVWLGLRSGAKEGRDSLDFAQPPPLDSGLRLSIEEEMAEQTVPHAGSFKPPKGEGHTWQVVLANRGEAVQEARLHFRSGGTRPEGQSRYVLDLSKGRRVAPGQGFELEAGEKRVLKVVVGTEDYAEKKSDGVDLGAFTNELRGNYPNPFGEETTLEYTLESEQEVTMRVYNVLGQRVRTLVQGKKKQAGVHRVQWKGENQFGKRVASGLYFYRIDGEDFTETRKMVLVR